MNLTGLRDKINMIGFIVEGDTVRSLSICALQTGSCAEVNDLDDCTSEKGGGSQRSVSHEEQLTMSKGVFTGLS